MGSPRITGDALRLTLDGTDYWADCTSVMFDQDDSLLGAKPLDQAIAHSDTIGWQMEVTAIQSTAGGSLWRLLFEHESGVWVPYEYSPHGNTTPSDDKPHFVGNLLLPWVTILGGEAGATTEYVFSVTLSLDRKPQMLTEPY